MSVVEIYQNMVAIGCLFLNIFSFFIIDIFYADTIQNVICF